MVRPHLEYLFQVQKRATKIPSKMNNMSFEDRIKTLRVIKFSFDDRKSIIIYIFH